MSEVTDHVYIKALVSNTWGCKFEDCSSTRQGRNQVDDTMNDTERRVEQYSLLSCWT